MSCVFQDMIETAPGIPQDTPGSPCTLWNESTCTRRARRILGNPEGRLRPKPGEPNRVVRRARRVQPTRHTPFLLSAKRVRTKRRRSRKDWAGPAANASRELSLTALHLPPAPPDPRVSSKRTKASEHVQHSETCDIFSRADYCKPLPLAELTWSERRQKKTLNPQIKKLGGRVRASRLAATRATREEHTNTSTMEGCAHPSARSVDTP